MESASSTNLTDMLNIAVQVLEGMDELTSKRITKGRDNAKDLDAEVNFLRDISMIKIKQAKKINDIYQKHKRIANGLASSEGSSADITPVVELAELHLELDKGEATQEEVDTHVASMRPLRDEHVRNYNHVLASITAALRVVDTRFKNVDDAATVIIGNASIKTLKLSITEMDVVLKRGLAAITA